MSVAYAKETLFNIEVRGRRYSGAWRSDSGKVLVSSAYGSAAGLVGHRRPDVVAVELLRELATKWA